MGKLTEIIKNFKRVCEETDITPDDNCLFDNACKLFISDKIATSKKENIKDMNESKELKNIINNCLATQPQIDLLNKLKIKFDSNITKKEAQILIGENM